MPPLYQVAACWTVGFLATNMSFGIAKKGSVSFTHAVKATEPVFLVIIASLFFHRSFPLGELDAEAPLSHLLATVPGPAVAVPFP